MQEIHGHEDIRYPCKLCEHQVARPPDLKKHKCHLQANDDLADSNTHKRANHGGELSTCDQCNYTQTVHLHRGSLKQHIQGHSEFLGSSPMENLKQHIDCNFACNRENDLRKHLIQKHTNYIDEKENSLKCKDFNFAWNKENDLRSTQIIMLI